MTPRIKELTAEADLSWFSEELLSQLKSPSHSYDLTGEGPLFKLTHPALIKCKYYHAHSPAQLVWKEQVADWYFIVYGGKSQALAAHPGCRSFNVFPFEIHQFLAEQPAEALLHFQHLGSAFLTKKPVPELEQRELHHYLLPLWLDYALSPELWGSAGKWTRFHERLHTLFTKYGLLIDQDSPGFYRLKKETLWLKKHGFEGRMSPHDYQLIFPWDFPLSGVIELEKVLARGP